MGTYYIRGTEISGKAERQVRQDARQTARDVRRAGRRTARDMRRDDEPEPSGPRLVETSPNLAKVKIYPLGVAAVAAAGGAFTFQPTAQHLFEPTRIIFQGTVSLNDVELTQLDIGNVSQLVVKNTVFPGSMFSPAADDVLCDLDVVTTGQDFSIVGVSQSIQRVSAGSYGNYFQSVNLVRSRRR